MRGLSLKLPRFEVTDHLVSLQVNPVFKDSTVEPQKEVSQSDKHLRFSHYSLY